MKSCDFCHKPFLPRRITSRFCSVACAKEQTGYGRLYGRQAPRQFGVWRPGNVQ